MKTYVTLSFASPFGAMVAKDAPVRIEGQKVILDEPMVFQHASKTIMLSTLPGLDVTDLVSVVDMTRLHLLHGIKLPWKKEA